MHLLNILQLKRLGSAVGSRRKIPMPFPGHVAVNPSEILGSTGGPQPGIGLHAVPGCKDVFDRSDAGSLKHGHGQKHEGQPVQWLHDFVPSPAFRTVAGSLQRRP